MPDDEAAMDPQLVITAPEPYRVALAYRTRSRTTLGVLTELVSHAERTLVLATPFIQAGEGLLTGPLLAAVTSALRRGVLIDLASTGAGLETAGWYSLASQHKGQVRLFRSATNVVDESRLGFHAKFCLADGTRGYVGSANFTGPGLSEHLEMGLLIQGTIVRQVQQLWDYCIEIGLFVQVA